MYPTRWGLCESPFRGQIDPQAFFLSPTHDEALARLKFLVQERRRLGLLVGPSGGGKSLLLEVFSQQFQRLPQPNAQVAKLSLLDVEPTEMLWLLAAEWGLNPPSVATSAWLWRKITDRLYEYRCQQIAAVVLLDDADQADPRVLQHVTRLAQCDSSPEMRLTIVLAGRNEGMTRLGESLRGLADLRIDVDPWDRNETRDFVDAQLSQAGGTSSVFDEPAIDRLHELAHGIPRRVLQLANLALLAGAGQNVDQIDAGVVDAASRELGVCV